MPIKKLEELEKLAKPLAEWLNKNFNPHTKIIIECNSAEVVSGEMCVPDLGMIEKPKVDYDIFKKLKIDK